MEAAGVARAWTYDHLAWRDCPTGSGSPPIPMLAAAAAMTSRIRLGPLVATPNFRHPVLLAKEIMTLDHLPVGRIDLGVGAGADGPDATVLGDNADRARSAAERFVRMGRTCWSPCWSRRRVDPPRRAPTPPSTPG